MGGEITRPQVLTLKQFKMILPDAVEPSKVSGMLLTYERIMNSLVGPFNLGFQVYNQFGVPSYVDGVPANRFLSQEVKSSLFMGGVSGNAGLNVHYPAHGNDEIVFWSGHPAHASGWVGPCGCYRYDDDYVHDRYFQLEAPAPGPRNVMRNRTVGELLDWVDEYECMPQAGPIFDELKSSGLDVLSVFEYYQQNM